MDNQSSTPAQPKRRRFIALTAAGGLLAIIALAGLLWFWPISEAPQVTFTGLDGQKQSTADLRGKVVLVNFWATSCTTCVGEMPKIIETYNKYHAQGFETIAVAMSYDRPDYVLNFATTRKLPFTVALDPQGELAKNFGNVSVTPTTFLIDKRGHVIRRYIGEPDFDALHALLEKELRG
ncbi:MAG: TlpA family protein disulfide reductase [Burkholderiaceae bacterium]|nr:MAG: TlpA family protein disulfide reductase [Burkholderiaceae bacterium]